MPPKTKKGADSQAYAADNAKAPKMKLKKSKSKDKSTNLAAEQVNGNMPKKAKKRTALIGRAPQLDPLLLARGMSSRYLSSKVSHQLTPLAKEAIEKDLRHMEAYRNACNGYNQQLFVYKNQELVRSGYFGTFAPFPGTDGDEHSSAQVTAKSPFSMPIKIDPEEEKRLILLRKKIHQSEFEREKLETEYLSLRAHYVHESQLVRKTRAYEMGRWKLLKDLVDRRGKVLGLMRVKIAMGRDIESLLKHRGELAGKVKNGDVSTDAGEVKKSESALTGMANGSGPNAAVKNGAIGAPSADAGAKKKAEGVTEKEVDLIEIWNDINVQLKEAELACMELGTPAVLSQMVAGSDQGSSSSRSRSPTRGDDKGGKSRKRSSSITSADDVTSEPGKKSKSPIPSGFEPHVVPWDCMVEPQTPYDVPILLSCLSSATDRAVGFVTDKTNPKAITWLESTLPESTGAFEAGAEDLGKLRDEVRILEGELNRESERNTELQKQNIASRSRSDEMVAMMQLLRSETEAVLERHNLIMETPEARARSAELHKKLLEEEKLKNPTAEGEDDEEEEGEVDENEELSSGEEEGQDDDEEEDRSDDESVGIKEITVDKDSNNVAGESDDDDVDDGSEEGEIVQGEEDEDEEPRRSKRRGTADEDESSSAGGRKRRRV